MSEVVGKKKYWSWTVIKNRLRKHARITGVKEGEIWWCAVGENIGVEINGKNSNYERPVLIFSKISRFGFVGIPLTSQKKEGTWYLHFKNQGKDEYAALTQIRFFSIHRVYRRLGQIDESDMERIAIGLYKILFDGKIKNVSSLATGVSGREIPEYTPIIPNQTPSVNTKNDKNTSSLSARVSGRDNPESASIIPNPPNLVKRLAQKLQKFFQRSQK